jgi:hypothetical protein
VVGAPALSCTQSVMRGGTLTCQVSGVAASRVTGWQLSGGGSNVQGQSGTLKWDGKMVVSGTVSVTVTGAGSLSQEVSVTARNWHLNVPDPVPDPSISLAVPPRVPLDLGLTVWHWGDYNYSYDTIDGGPNSGFTYFTSQFVPSDLRFTYSINSDLATPASVFSQHQCGGASGWISWSDLHTQTKRHEYDSSTQSHWAFYRNSMEEQDMGGYVESRTARPGSSVQTFISDTLNELRAREGQINTEEAKEPNEVNVSESGTFLGNINFGPNYATCQ